MSQPQKFLMKHWVDFAETHMKQSDDMQPEQLMQAKNAFFHGASILVQLMMHCQQKSFPFPLPQMINEINEHMADTDTIVRVRRAVVPIGMIQMVGYGDINRVEVMTSETLREKLGRDTVAYFKGKWDGKQWILGDRVDDQDW